MLLDTTTSCTHYNQVQAQPGAPFPRRRYVFNTYSALKAYWSDLQCIALNTPLGELPRRLVNRFARSSDGVHLKLAACDDDDDDDDGIMIMIMVMVVVVVVVMMMVIIMMVVMVLMVMARFMVILMMREMGMWVLLGGSR